VKRILLAVTNDISTDNRIHKISCTLLKSGAKVSVVGRKRPNSIALDNRPYQTKRFRLVFKKGPCFYMEYNFRLFFYILFRKFDIIVSNDLDTLLGSFLATRIKSGKLVYDSHEYFTEVPELQDRKRTQNIWKSIEKRILPKVKYAYTVSESIAAEYQKLYGIKMGVVRNLPNYINSDRIVKPEKTETFKILYQGSLNIGRGLEQLIDSIQYIENAKLIIVGDGDIIDQLQQQIQDKKLEEKIDLKGRISINDLKEETQKADLGVSLEENLGLNYYFALPNKLFDYIQARVPVLVSPFPEMQKIIDQYEIGTTYVHKNPQALAEKIKEIINQKEIYQKWKNNTEQAAKELCWEIEESIIVEIFTKAGLTFRSF
jgi:glycosyltransferase involved in cell wall biosynthesis